MTIKLLIIAVCAALGTATGYVVMLSYKKRSCYMSGICALIGEMKRNISYRRDAVTRIAGNYSGSIESALLKKHIEEYATFVAAKDGKLALSRGYLSADVYSSVCSMFSALGKTDEKSQIDELDMFESVFSGYREKACERVEKYGALAVKLGFLLGLGVGVLFL